MFSRSALALALLLSLSSFAAEPDVQDLPKGKRPQARHRGHGGHDTG